MLYAEADGLFFAADQVLAKITPNVSVWAVDPDGDPLALYLRSLRALKAQVKPDVLVLPGHQLPFYGLHTRADELIAHHEVRCDMILSACKGAPHSAAELVPVLFAKALDPHQMSFAFSETQAHINYLIGRGTLAAALSADGIERVRSRRWGLRRARASVGTFLLIRRFNPAESSEDAHGPAREEETQHLPRDDGRHAYRGMVRRRRKRGGSACFARSRRGAPLRHRHCRARRGRGTAHQPLRPPSVVTPARR